ncbi:MAG: nucleotidyltransferase domain-containing protein [Alphaproteobacteria bacterium]|nr:nucleotidyltransferase domain-containing protein [Alphaproteobacteria bacterium]
MKDWELALNKFMRRYVNKPWFEGALLCGSYASGNQNEFSDIDVTIIASDDLGWQEKSNCYVDGFLIECTINPLYKNQEYMKIGLENHSMINQTMFAYGIVLSDKHGEIEKLRKQSIRELKRKIKPHSKYSNDFRKYSLWCRYDDMLALKKDGYPIDLLYWTLVDKLIDAYYDFNCLPHVSHAKIQKILTDKEFAKRYHVKKQPDGKFTELLLDCFNVKQKDKLPAIDKFYNYVMESGGGFDIGKFIGRRKIEKK